MNAVGLSAFAVVLALAALAIGVSAHRRARTATPGGHTGNGTHQSAFHARVIEGQARRDLTEDSREYSLHVALENAAPTAADISQAMLRVTYRTRANFLGAVDLAPTQEPKGQPPLVIPARIPPSSTVDGWLFFRTVNVIPRHCRAQDYALVITHADGRRVLADASLPALLASDTDGQGPATWGWD